MQRLVQWYIFQNDDRRFHENLAKQNVNVGTLQPGTLDWIFQAWLEKWELQALHVNSLTTSTMVKTKYEGLVFFDPDPDSNCIRIVLRNNWEFF